MNKARLYPGGIFHVYTRGNNRETLFKSSENYAYFLRLWKKHISPIAKTYAYCLMSNHIHFCIHIKESEEFATPLDYESNRLSKAFSNCFNAYAKAINKAYSRTGCLFEGTYRRKEVADNNYLQGLIGYIHANPQHHGYFTDFRSYSYSSYRALISDKPTSISRAEVLQLFGGREDFLVFHEDQKNWREFIR